MAASPLETLVEFYVYSRGAIERITPHEAPHVIISITTTAEETARLPICPFTAGVLRLCFADADRVSSAVPQAALFSEGHAAQIWSFVTAHAGAIERIIVHCDAGLSRSPAVAAAIAKALGEDDSEFFRRYRPNAHVYRMLLENALGVPTSG